ncbi:Protein REVERSION-TO-ETHYLENE SENSITIVITY1 [Castilleja foliolosa]|uniref:Protein REVERSION-TO-ETHYLENE SENSITIVITY1 n=1 Tax=Castilleja foliolosa TaxID=1961234 RepID=A0ABD3CU38_9LAMI
MEINLADEIESKRLVENIAHDFWPLAPVDHKKAKFPCCLVWTPLPVVSWLAPFIGHVGICNEDGTILDFSGSNLVSVDAFAFGSVARYLQLDREQCCFPPNITGHKCKHRFAHSELGAAITWDDAVQSSGRRFEHRSYNLFTCNCHSFVANCLNRLCYGGSMDWNMVDVATLMLFKAKWVGPFSVLRSFLPFITVLGLGIFVVGWPFLIGLFLFSFLLVGWFLLATYCFKNLLEC